MNGMQVALGTELNFDSHKEAGTSGPATHAGAGLLNSLKGRRSRFLPELLHKTQSG